MGDQITQYALRNYSKMTKKQEKTKQDRTALLKRYALVGAGLGIYFGFFFRPVREPSLLVVVGLSLLIAVVTVILKLVRRERPSLNQLLKDAGITFAKYALVLAVLEGRHLAHDYGGRWAVTVMTTVMGALVGLWWGYEQTVKDGRALEE